MSQGPEWPPVTEASRMGIMEAAYGDKSYGDEPEEGDEARKEGGEGEQESGEQDEGQGHA